MGASRSGKYYLMHGRSQSRGRLHVVAAIVQLQTQLVDMLEELILLGQQFPCTLAAMLRCTQTGIPTAVESLPETHGTHAGNGTQYGLGAMCEWWEQWIQILVQGGVNMRPQGSGLVLQIYKKISNIFLRITKQRQKVQ